MGKCVFWSIDSCLMSSLSCYLVECRVHPVVIAVLRACWLVSLLIPVHRHIWSFCVILVIFNWFDLPCVCRGDSLCLSPFPLWGWMKWGALQEDSTHKMVDYFSRKIKLLGCPESAAFVAAFWSVSWTNSQGLLRLLPSLSFTLSRSGLWYLWDLREEASISSVQ